MVIMVIVMVIDHDNHHDHHAIVRCTKLQRFARRRRWCLWTEAQAGRLALQVNMVVVMVMGIRMIIEMTMT